MDLVRLLMLTFLGHFTVGLRSSYWTRSSKYYPAPAGRPQYWGSLTQCVAACLNRDDCNTIVIKSGTKGTKSLCWLFNNRFVATHNEKPSQFLLYETQASEAVTITTPAVSTSRRRAELNARVASLVPRNPQLAVLQQYNTSNNGRSATSAFHVLKPKTWTFMTQGGEIEGKVLRAVMDREKIYWFEDINGQGCIALKSVSRQGLTKKVTRVCAELMDIDIQKKTLYFVKKRTRNVFKKCIEPPKHSYGGAQNVYILLGSTKLSCLRVDKERLYWCNKLFSFDMEICFKDFSSPEPDQCLKLKQKDGDIYIFPFKQHVYWTDKRGGFSVSTFKDKTTERLPGCESTVRSLGSLGRYGELWYLTCHTGTRRTEIHFYDYKMKKVKSLEVDFEGVAASCIPYTTCSTSEFSTATSRTDADC